MGSWSIAVHGHGIHDNALDGDVDRLLEEFLASLRDKGGHIIDSAHLTVGSGRKYQPPSTSSGQVTITHF